LPSAITARVAIEAGASGGWYQFVGLQGRVLGIDQFGLSAPAEQVYQTLGLTVDHLKQQLLALI
jgi:transketolase